MAKDSNNTIDLIDIKEYNGQQILINSNRLVFNTDKDSILFRTPKYCNISAGEKITFDVGKSNSTDIKNQFLVNAPNIQFGLPNKGRTVEPAVKGNTLADVLIRMLDTIDRYAEILTATTAPTIPMTTSTAKFLLSEEISTLKLKVQEIKSDIVYLI